MPANRLARALIQRQEQQSLPDKLISLALPVQKAAILDPARFKGFLASRRSGKSYGIGIYLLYIALSNDKVKCLYFGKTKDASVNIMYLHIIYHLLEQLGLKQGTDYKWNKNEKTITFANRSSIVLTGADASEQQIEKALGGKYKLVIFDEAQTIRNDLERWVYDRLSPAMVDMQGTIVLAGTSGDFMGSHFWYKITKTDGIREAGWSVHYWKWSDNLHMKDLIRKEIDRLIELNPAVETEPGFRQEWLCEWIIDRSGRIYKYNPTLNALTDPDKIDSIFRDQEWKFIIGVDFGFEDDTALVVGAFSKYDPICYIVDSFKKPKMITQEVAETILLWRDKYNPVYIVVDSQNKTLVETLKITYRIPLVGAQKLGKEAHIAALNSDLITGKLKVIPLPNKDLIEEWNLLTWSESARARGLYKENASRANHLADAALYLHHFSKHYRAVPKPIDDPHISPFRIQAEKELMRQKSNSHNYTDNLIYDYIDTMNILDEHRNNR